MPRGKPYRGTRRRETNERKMTIEIEGLHRFLSEEFILKIIKKTVNRRPLFKRAVATIKNGKTQTARGEIEKETIVY